MAYFVENKEKVIERWDRLEFWKGLKGDLDETISKFMSINKIDNK